MAHFCTEWCTHHMGYRPGLAPELSKTVVQPNPNPWAGLPTMGLSNTDVAYRCDVHDCAPHITELQGALEHTRETGHTVAIVPAR